MEPKIVGTTMPILELTLSPGEQIVAEGGDVSWLTTGFRMRLRQLAPSWSFDPPGTADAAAAASAAGASGAASVTLGAAA